MARKKPNVIFQHSGKSPAARRMATPKLETASAGSSKDGISEVDKPPMETHEDVNVLQKQTVEQEVDDLDGSEAVDTTRNPHEDDSLFVSGNSTPISADMRKLPAFIPIAPVADEDPQSEAVDTPSRRSGRQSDDEAFSSDSVKEPKAKKAKMKAPIAPNKEKGKKKAKKEADFFAGNASISVPDWFSKLPSYDPKKAMGYKHAFPTYEEAREAGPEEGEVRLFKRSGDVPDKGLLDTQEKIDAYAEKVYRSITDFRHFYGSASGVAMHLLTGVYSPAQIAAVSKAIAKEVQKYHTDGIEILPSKNPNVFTKGKISKAQEADDTCEERCQNILDALQFNKLMAGDVVSGKYSLGEALVLAPKWRFKYKMRMRSSNDQRKRKKGEIEQLAGVGPDGEGNKEQGAEAGEMAEGHLRQEEEIADAIS